MTPKADYSELIAVRTLTEQRWAYERRLEHLSYSQMRSLVNQPPHAGGLGYDLSEQALKGLVKGYLERMREVDAVDLEEQRARELADLDLEQRRLDAVAAIAAKRIAEADEMDALDVHASKIVLAATRERRAAGESRRRLLGLDAPQAVKVDVHTHDAVLDELNAMLARAGRDPIEVDQ